MKPCLPRTLIEVDGENAQVAMQEALCFAYRKVTIKEFLDTAKEEIRNGEEQDLDEVMTELRGNKS